MADSDLFVVRSPEEFRQILDGVRRTGRRVGFVPTMGALHEGHLALVRHARTVTEFVAVSIFVNPTQFGPNEDFARYPRDLENDAAKVRGAGANVVFAPEVSAMYPTGDQTRVRVGTLAEPLCGAHRPGHFEGVATVVAKLFGMAGPSTAVFGKKDYQQLAVIRRLAKDLFFPVDVVGHPIVREADGLAMSSRNAYLSPEQRLRALGLARGLLAAHTAFKHGERKVAKLELLAHSEVERIADAIDYVSLANVDDLSGFGPESDVPERVLLAIACRVGSTRLIDNIVLGEDDAPTVAR